MVHLTNMYKRPAETQISAATETVTECSASLLVSAKTVTETYVVKL